MNKDTEFSISELRKKQADVTGPAPSGSAQDGQGNDPSRQSDVINIPSAAAPRSLPPAAGAEEGESLNLPFDPMRLADAILRRWYFWIGVGVICGAGAFWWCFSHVETVAAADLIRRDAPMLVRASENGDAFKPQQYTEATLSQLIRSPEIYRRVSVRSKPYVPANKLARLLSANSDRETELVTLAYNGGDKPAVAVNLLNLFAEEIVRFTQEMQAREGNETARFLGEKLAAVETNLASVHRELQSIPADMKVLDPDKQTESYLLQLSDLDVKCELARIDLEANNPQAEKLQAARDDLNSLLVRYTEAHPLVQDAQAKVKALEAQLGPSANFMPGASNAPSPGNARQALASAQNRALLKQLQELTALRQRIQEKLKGLTEKNLDYALIKNRYQSLELMRTMLLSRQGEAQLYAQDALGYYRILHPASLDRAGTKVNLKKNLMLVLAAAFFGMGCAIGLVGVSEVINTRIKTAADLQRVSGLPVLATLGDLAAMDEAAQKAWAFRTWTIIKGKITENQHHSMVCGIISAEHGEGRSTWIKLLAQTAHQRGLRVLVAATRPTPDPPLHPHEKEEKPEGTALAVSTPQSVVAFPFQATQQLNDPKSHAIVQIPLPGWVWNLERRQQWQAALAEWQKIEHLVFLVELPPASEPEAILLAENLPQLIWFCDSGKVSSIAARRHLETLRHAGCNLVGALLNREPPSFCRNILSRWIGLGAILICLSGGSLGAAGETNGLPNPQAGASKVMRPAWTRHLTLGPGDIVTFSFFGETNLTKSDITIPMDGRVSYLQARDILATGLTVDDLRDKINADLGKYYRTPRAVVTPVAYLSKRYFVLGRVMLKGAFALDRPVTVLEAVTRAHGLERGELDRNSVELADFQHSFLIRDQKRLPIDLERLFQQGDFTQNVSLEPNDFLYFAKANLQEIYVLGQVRNPGITPYTDHASVIRVITERGGFTERAWKNRVLVIRGSLQHPEVFTVNTWAVLDAREADFRLQPRDIVYVNDRPFLRGEELLDLGVTAFLQSAVTSWTGANVGPIFTTPFVPSL